MLKIKNYVKAESLEQAYELNQKRTACVLGGMVWLKMGNRNIMTAIDLSGLGLDTITETEFCFSLFSSRVPFFVTTVSFCISDLKSETIFEISKLVILISLFFAFTR